MLYYCMLQSIFIYFLQFFSENTKEESCGCSLIFGQERSCSYFESSSHKSLVMLIVKHLDSFWSNMSQKSIKVLIRYEIGL